MKKVLRKLAVLAMAAAMTLSMAVGASASTFSMDDAYAKALKSANTTAEGVKYVEKEYDDGVYEVEFTKKSNGAEYTFEYSKKGTLLEKSVDYNREKVTGEKKLTKKQAKAKVVAFGGFKKATVDKADVYLEKDDGQWIYEVKFKTEKYRYNYEVHARTGKILEYSKHRR